MRLLPVLFLWAASCAVIWGINHHDEARKLQRWDYWPPLPTRPIFSGHYLSSKPGRNHLKPQSFAVLDIFKLDAENPHTNVLLYGSVLLRPTVFGSIAAMSNPAVRSAFDFAVQTIKASNHGHLSPDTVLQGAVLLPLAVTGDNGESEMVVVHHHTTTRRDVMQFKSHVSLGINFFLTIEDAKFGLRHRVVVALDRDGAHNLFQHTFASLSATSLPSSSSCAAGAGGGDACEGEQQTSRSSKPRILSFNVWNTNPSADVYGATRRWDQYIKRLDHLVKVVKDVHADIIGFQEVRYDGVFGGRAMHAQVEHLATQLPGYQFVYQAAMSYLNDRSPFERIEEGPAIFSKFPIVETDYLLLSRNPNDPNDSHQRLCLHAVVDHPTWGYIDVYVTHLSLSERSRERTIVEIWEYMKLGKGVTQVLLGDLNAEPQSRGIQFLRGDATLGGVRGDLQDAWLAKHTEPEPRSDDAVDKATKFTFPSDAPCKRIDFVLFRGKGSVTSCEVIGQEPTEATQDFPQNVGMLHPRSPVYPSDHRGVVAEFEA